MARYKITHIKLFVCVIYISKAWTCAEPATTLQELDRRSRTYRANGLANDLLVDDFYLDDNWFTVNNQRGQYALVDKIPRYGVCGTRNPIYLKDPHPDVTSLGETPVDVDVCLKNDFDDCAVTYTIQIRFCASTIQYHLVTTMQYSAYCFDPPELQDIADIAPAPTDVNLGEIKVVPELKFKNIPDDDRIKFDPYLEFTCSFLKQGSYLYTVTWYYNGKIVDSYGPTDELESLKLREETLLNIQAAMGFNVICGIRVSKAPLGITTHMESSDEFFVGIKIPNLQIYMDKTGSKDIELIQTVPIGCQYSTQSEEGPCFFRLAMADLKKYECLQGNIVQESATPRCGLDLQALRKDHTWDPNGVKHTFKVTTKDENYEDRKLYKLHLETAKAGGHKIWLNYQTSEVQVNVVNTKAHIDKKCYSHIDPHMRTGDGSYYENQRSGDFMLYRNKKYDIQVHERLILCNRNRAWCACALGVRAGGDIFIINLCPGTVKLINYKQCKDGGTITVVQISNTHYEIITPIGTRIDAKFYGGNTIMNIDITMAPKDMFNTDGLCGFVDGKINNDFRKRDETQTDSQRFAIDWKLRDHENVFIHDDFPGWSEINNVFCVCEQAFNKSINASSTAEAVCAPSMDLICKRKHTEKDRNCIKMVNRKRSISNKMSREIDRKLNAKIPIHNVKIIKRQTISESEARDHCAYKINGSLAFTKFSDKTAGENPDAVIEQCQFDVLAADDLAYAGIHVDALNTIVSKTFDFIPGYVANNTDTVTYFKQNSCPNNCSERGNCNTEGICECYTYYHGPECEIDERIAPIIIDTEGGGECDLQDGDGCGCLSFSTDNLIQNFTCQLSGEIVYDNNETESITMIRQVGHLEDIFTGICCVPESRAKRSTSDTNTFAVRYDISISNNGENFGNIESILVLDSACQTSTHDQDGTPVVQLKPDTCYILGECIASQSTKYQDDCYVCDPNLNQRNWTHVCIKVAGDSNTKSKTGVIIGTTVGLGVALGSVLLLLLLWKYKISTHIKKRKSVGNSLSTFNSQVISQQQSL